MQKLIDTIIKGFSISIKDIRLSDEKNLIVVVRFFNTREVRQKLAIEESRMISQNKGILYTERIEPFDVGYNSIGIELLPSSFVDVNMEFATEKLLPGDKIELYLYKKAKLLIEYIDNDWYVNDCNELVEGANLTTRVEHFEVLEDKIGIVLQNFSIKIEKNYISAFCEVLSNGEGPKCDFSIEVAVYDIDNQIVAFGSIHKNKDDFMGFEVFSFSNLSIDIPLNEISKIVFYPTK